MLEQAVSLSVKLQDEAAFERNYLQLKTYYTDTRSAHVHNLKVESGPNHLQFIMPISICKGLFTREACG